MREPTDMRAGAPAAPDAGKQADELTGQEIAALCLIASGADQRAAAKLAEISPRTLRRRLADAQVILGACGVTHAVALAVDRRLVRPASLTPALAEAVRRTSGPPCGTVAGYAHHVQHDQVPCAWCAAVWDVRLATLNASRTGRAPSIRTRPIPAGRRE